MGLGTPLGGGSQHETVETKHLCGFGHPVRYLASIAKWLHACPALWCWAMLISQLFSFHHQPTAPSDRGLGAATTTMQFLRRMEWRPLLLYAYPLGQRIPDNLKNH